MAAKESDDEVVWEQKWVGRPKGTQHGRSADGDGSSSAAVFKPGERGIQTNAKIRDLDDPAVPVSAKPKPKPAGAKGTQAKQPSSAAVSQPHEEPEYVYTPPARSQANAELVEIGVGVLNHVIDVAVEKLTPVVQKWWEEQAVPGLKARARLTVAKLAQAREAGRFATRKTSPAVIEIADPTNALAVVEPTDVLATAEREPAVDRIRITRSDAERLLLEAALARAWSDATLRDLFNAEFVDSAGVVQPALAGQATPEELGTRLSLLLEAKPELLNEILTAILVSRANADADNASVVEPTQGALPQPADSK